MKITDTLITTILKHGVFGEMRNFKTAITIPSEEEDGSDVEIVITADSVQLKMATKETNEK